MHQAAKHVDTLIIGDGLAGSILGWHLHQQGQSILIIGNPDKPPASRVAAGLINPVTGKRLVLQSNAGALLEAAISCYQALESHLGCQLYYPLPMLRILRNEDEIQALGKRRGDPAYTAYIDAEQQPTTTVRAPLGCITQKQTGYLDTNTLLDTLHAHFRSLDAHLSADFEYSELKLHTDGVQWCNTTADRIIFCEGYRGADNPWFGWLPFQPAAGEILSFTSHEPLPDKIVNGGKWLMPRHDGSYKTGATFHHTTEPSAPTETGRRMLLDALSDLLTEMPRLEITNQQAGVRPGTRDKQPFIGMHPKLPRLGIFNGFGSKGSMLIPWHAGIFAEHLLHGASLPQHCDIARISMPRKSLTALVHQTLQLRLKSGSTAIDATAGNGHDTLFLAKIVGANGKVFAFDIQASAIAATKKRIAAAALDDRVTLIHAGHEHMVKHIPAQLHGSIDTITFNLGYLPGADKSVITEGSSTLAALKEATRLLADSGYISILAYPGHPGGREETEAVKRWALALGVTFKVSIHPPISDAGNSPEWIEIERISTEAFNL